MKFNFLIKYLVVCSTFIFIYGCSDKVDESILFKNPTVVYPKNNQFTSKYLPNGDVMLITSDESGREQFGVFCRKQSTGKYSAFYEGEIENGQYHGVGKLLEGTGTGNAVLSAQWYMGSFSHGKIEGYGIMKKNQLGIVNSIYYGQFKDGKEEGNGSEFSHLGMWSYHRGNYKGGKAEEGGVSRIEMEMSQSFIDQVFTPLDNWLKENIHFKYEIECQKLK